MIAPRTVRPKVRSAKLEDAENLDSLVCDVQSAILTCAYAPVRGLKCDCHEGTLVVSGRLPSFYLRQVAIALVAKIAGVRFDDAIEVE